MICATDGDGRQFWFNMDNVVYMHTTNKDGGKITRVGFVDGSIVGLQELPYELVHRQAAADDPKSN